MPRPTQLSGAKFLADRAVALLADEPRVGKTGTAIIAADYILARTILVVTTASGRPVLRRGMAEWSAYRRTTQVLTPKDTLAAGTEVAVVGWPSIAAPALRAQLLRRTWDLLILDESHYAKSFEAKRTQAVYGEIYGQLLLAEQSLASRAAVTWCLTGTPLPNSPADAYPMLRALAPARLTTAWGPDDVTVYEDFRDRYCHWRPKKIGHGAFTRSIPVIMGGKNEAELKARLEGFGLRRTQADVGIGAPVYEILPLLITETQCRKVDRDVDARAVMAAADAGATKALEMHLGPLRRVTGEIKAHAAVEAVRDEFEAGLDKIVLMAWHTDVIRILAEGLSQFGVVCLDGSTSADNRQRAVDSFRDDPAVRVFVGQIVAAGEAIDLSAAATLWFVESSFQPAQMKQASLRITNFSQTRQVVVRVCALEGSIDDALQTTLLRKWASIREVTE